MQNTESPLTHLSIGKAAKYLGVSIDTLRRWEKKGKLSTHRSPGGHRYFLKKDLDQAFAPKAKEEKVNLQKEEVKENRIEEETIPTPSAPQIMEPQLQAEVEIPTNEPLSWQSSEPIATPQEEPLVLNESESVIIPEAPSYQPPYVEEITPNPTFPGEELLSKSEDSLISIRENILKELPKKKSISKIYFIFLALFLIVDIFLFFYWLGLRNLSPISPFP